MRIVRQGAVKKKFKMEIERLESMIYRFTARAPIDFGNNRIEPIGNRFSVGKFNRIYRYFGFGKLPFGFGKFGFGFGFSIYRTDLPIM